MNLRAELTSLLNTKLLMTGSAGFMVFLGLGISFFPQELLTAVQSSSPAFSVLLASITGCLYFSFGILNWMAREKLIGGIYSRPVALGNFAHFFAVSLVLIKHLPGSSSLAVFAVLTGIYALFAAAFGVVTFAGGKTCQ